MQLAMVARGLSSAAAAVAAAACCLHVASALNNGLARTPEMG
jgi:hypothetical protein